MNRIAIIGSFITFFNVSFCLYGQGVNASYTGQGTYCQKEVITLTNTSSNFKNVAWDLCPNDLSAVPSINENIPVNLTNVFGLKVIEQNDNYFGFGVNWKTNSLIRLEFGNSLQNTPQVTDLGDLGVLNAPEGIDIVKDGNKWVGLVGYLLNAGAGSVTRLVWNDLTQMPSVTSIGNFGVTSRLRDVQIIKQNGHFVAVFPYDKNTIIRVDFGSSLLNNIGSGNIYQTGVLPDLNGAVSLSVTQRNGDWVAVVASANSNSLTLFNFGNDIFSSPIEIKTQNFSSFSNSAKIKVLKNPNSYYAYLSTYGGIPHVINLKQLVASDNFEDVSLGLTKPVYGIDFVQDSSRTFLFGAANTMTRIIFQDTCQVSKYYSEEDSVSAYFTAPGTYPITLRAYDADGFYDDTTQYITITSNVAPNVDFSTGANLCFDQAIQFSGTTNGVVNAGDWQWDFGDGNTGTGQQVNHQYAAAGHYTVALQITDQGGCTNQVQKDITVYGPPTVDFSYSAPNECSSIPFTFVDQSSGTSPEATYTWNFDDGTSASGDTATHAFPVPQTYLVSLTVSQKGCNATTTKSVTVNEGPDVAFTSPTGCAGESLTFQNQSTGNYITGYNWDFGDGYTATTENPVHAYAAYGSYLVQLGAQTSNGCDYTLTQTVNVEDVPVADFSYTLSCQGQEVQFTAASSVQNANISSYRWDFGTGNAADTSILANPSFTFAKTGDYLVQLAVSSDQGCGATVTKTVSVLESPVIGATYQLSCVGNSSQLNDNSSPGGAGSFQYYYWEIRDAQNALVTTSSLASFGYTFDQAGTYYVYHAVQPQNLCSVDQLDTITIAGVPLPDFSASPVCPGYSMQLVNTTNYQGGTATSVSWDGDVQGSYIGDSVTVTFPGAGTYLISQHIATKEGCSTTLTKTITVSERPTAAIKASSTVGGPPLQVDFSPDDTTGLALVQWFIRGVSDSLTTGIDFQYTFKAEGVYQVGMIYQLTGQCVDTAFQEVSVVKPVLNLAVSNVQVVPSGADHQVLVALKNTGNLPMDSIRLAIQLDQGFTFYEWYPGVLNAGEGVTYPVKSMLGEAEFARIKSVCVTASVYDDKNQETTLSDNSNCVSLFQDFYVGRSYPNPATGDQLSIPLLLPAPGTVQLSFVRPDGQEAYPQSYDLEAGPQMLQINTKPLGQGVYLLKISYQQQVKVQRIAIVR